MELIFRIGKKYESSVKVIVAAGLEHVFLDRMNERFCDAPASFYMPLWNGMIFNAFIEWAKAGMPGSVEDAISQVNAGLKLVASSIETGLRNKTPYVP